MKKVHIAIIFMCLLSLFGCTAYSGEKPAELPPALPACVYYNGNLYSHVGDVIYSLPEKAELIGETNNVGSDMKSDLDSTVNGYVYTIPDNSTELLFQWKEWDEQVDGKEPFLVLHSSSEENNVAESDIGSVDVQAQPLGRGLFGYTGYVDEALSYMYRDEFSECDYDGDGKTDRLYRIDDVSYYMSEYRIDFGNGDKLYSGNVAETAYPHVYPVDLDKDGDNDIVLTYTVEPADREPFTWCDIFCYDSSHRIYMKEESVLHSSGGISHLPIKLQRISSYEAAFTVVNTDFTGFIGLDRYYQKYDDVMLDQFWENVESNDNIIEAMIVYAEVEYGDDPCIHCYADTVNGGWYYIEFDIVFEEGEYQITNLNKVFDPFSAEFSDSFASGIIPSYVPSDVILEKVKISSDDPYEGMITSIGDFNKDGLTEKIVVDYRDILADGIAVPGRIAVYDADGNILWNDTFSLAYAGWCRFYIAEIDNIPCLIRYFPPTARQGSWECYLQVYTLNSDNEFATSEQIVCDGTEENAEECKAIAEQYLEHAVMVVSTMDSELKVYK